MEQQLAGPLNAEPGEIVAGRAAKLRLKGPVQTAPADAAGPGGLLHPHIAGIVALEKVGALPGIAAQGLFAPGGGPPPSKDPEQPADIPAMRTAAG